VGDSLVFVMVAGLSLPPGPKGETPKAVQRPGKVVPRVCLEAAISSTVLVMVITVGMWAMIIVRSSASLKRFLYATGKAASLSCSSIAGKSDPTIFVASLPSRSGSITNHSTASAALAAS